MIAFPQPDHRKSKFGLRQGIKLEWLTPKISQRLEKRSQKLANPARLGRCMEHALEPSCQAAQAVFECREKRSKFKKLKFKIHRSAKYTVDLVPYHGRWSLVSQCRSNPCNINGRWRRVGRYVYHGVHTCTKI